MGLLGALASLALGTETEWASIQAAGAVLGVSAAELGTARDALSSRGTLQWTGDWARRTHNIHSHPATSLSFFPLLVSASLLITGCRRGGPSRT